MSSFGRDTPDHTQIYVAAISQGMATGNQSFVPMWFVGQRKGDVRTSMGHRANIPISLLWFGTNWSYYKFERNRGGGWSPYCISSSKPPQNSEDDACCLVNSVPFKCHMFSPQRHHNSHPSQRGWFR
ncbi:hypothetical protein C8_440 [Cannes 8 virus]|nr:hypothetical protein C8_440 [Cannes 8 virus]AIT54983.2 hypothetical protein MEL_370 [Melbournevirus]